MLSQTNISYTKYTTDRVQKLYLKVVLSLIILVHFIEIINYFFQGFPLLILINFFCIIFILILLRRFLILKNIDKAIKGIIIIESISIFIHILFIWKVFPEVFIWTGCILVSILLFFNDKDLLKYIFFSTFLFISAPTFSIIFGLNDYFEATVKNFKDIHFQLLYLNIIGATILLIVITLSYKKYILLKKFNQNRTIITPESYYSFPNSLNNDDDDVNKAQLNRLFEKIKYYIENEKKYLDPNFNLKELSITIGSNISYVSKCINTYNETNFNDFINKYRIDYFKNLIIHFDEERKPIKDIYSKCGFKQQSTFNRVFKQFEGITPTEYIDNLDR